MKNIDDEIRFVLSGQGWYVGEPEITISKHDFKDVGIDPGVVYLTSSPEASRRLAWTDGGRIYIASNMVWIASLMKIKFAVLHEYAHMKFGHCGHPHKISRTESHSREYACDLWALKQLINSRKFNAIEILDAIGLFETVSNEEESDTHPSSSNRHKMLLKQLKENGL